MSGLTEARRRVLKRLHECGGKATNYDLAYPRSNMMHSMFMAGLLDVDGPTDAFGEPRYDGFWVLTPAGRAALGGNHG